MAASPSPPISTSQARSLIRRHTDLDPNSLKEIGRGTDSVAYSVNGEWVVRFSTPAAEQKLRVEAHLLQDLGTVLPVDVPSIDRIVADGQSLLSVSRLLPGEPLTSELFQRSTTARKERTLQSLAKFLKDLHRYSLDAARQAGVRDELFSGGYHPAQRELVARVEGLLDSEENSALQRIFLDYERAFFEEQRSAVVHADLKPVHVLAAPDGTVVSILDWGDASLGDPAFDLAVIGMFFGSELLVRLLDHSHDPQHDPDRQTTMAKIRFFQIVRTVQDLAYAKAGGNRLVLTESLRSLRERLSA